MAMNKLKIVKEFSEIPRITSLPILGSLWLYLPFIGKYDLKRSKKSALKKYLEYGPIVRENISWSKKQVHVFDPDDIETVLRQEGKYPQREQLTSLKNYMLDRKDVLSHVGLFHADGEDWHSLRSKIQPHVMKPSVILSYLTKMDQASTELCDKIKSNLNSNLEVEDLTAELNKWALECLGLFVLNTRLGCLHCSAESDANMLINAVNEMFHYIYKLEFGYFQLWRWVKTPTYVKFHEVLKSITRVSETYLHETKSRMSRNESNDSGFIGKLLSLGLDDKIVLVAMHDMLLAGIDSTSSSVAFFLYHMSKNQDHQDRVAAEIKSFIPEKNSPIPESYSRHIPYLKACLKESMRLTQASRSIQRILSKDTIIRGYAVPAGTQVILQTTAACNMNEHFPDATEFRPERWIGSKVEKDTHPFAFMPFGFGPRSCVGRRLSEQEMFTALIRIFRNFRLEYHHEDIDCLTKFVNFPDQPLRFEFHERHD